MTTDKKASIHQIINTVLLSIIGIVSTLIFLNIKNIREKTDLLMIDVSIHTEQIKTLKADVQDQKGTRQWAEDNFLRKPGK